MRPRSKKMDNPEVVAAIVDVLLDSSSSDEFGEEEIFEGPRGNLFIHFFLVPNR